MKVRLSIHPENIEYETPVCWQRPSNVFMRLGRFLCIMFAVVGVAGVILATCFGT